VEAVRSNPQTDGDTLRALVASRSPATEEEALLAVRLLLSYIGEDPAREGLLDTPKRVVKAWDEMTCGYGQDPAAILGSHFDGEGYDQMVLCRDIEFYSTCEHHLLPFSGVAHIAYVPRSRVVGLSKMARLLDCFARRLQIQEKLTKQVAVTMMEVLKPLGVGVMVEAKHLCMACRGVQKQKSTMVTTALHGVFKRHAVREEFFLQCRR
jgi:GTP cyclohydrolase IA